MKRFVVSVTMLFIFSSLSAQDLGAVTDPKDLAAINRLSFYRLDAYSLVSIIRNGNLDTLVPAYITDIQLGVLNRSDLRLLRNTVYAMHGLAFTAEDLREHFGAFPWYKAIVRNIDDVITPNETDFINRIKLFEAGPSSSGKLSRSDILGSWRKPNGGADQAGTKFRLEGDGRFVYTYKEWYIERTTALIGTWEYANSQLTLDINSQDLALGGTTWRARMESLLRMPSAIE